MKEISELRFPDDVRYAEEHEWTRTTGETVQIGISDYAQDQLGDIVFVDLPQKGAVFSKGDEFGTVESVKAVSELFMPIGGKVVEVNAALEEAPELVNSDPYGGGWMVALQPDDPAELDALMDREAYLAMLKG
jgi:glycine cleavage system H protein